MADKKQKFFKVKFSNQERKGERHMWSSNGEIFDVKHGETKVLPEHAITALNDAVKIEWRMKDQEISKVPEKYEDPRFFVHIIEEVKEDLPVSDGNMAKDSIISEITKTQQGARA